MGFDGDSHPPMPVSNDSGAHGEEMTLQTTDGTQMASADAWSRVQGFIARYETLRV